MPREHHLVGPQEYATLSVVSQLTIPSETEILRRYAIAMGFIGFIECALVCVLAAINPRLRRWPGTCGCREIH